MALKHTFSLKIKTFFWKFGVFIFLLLLYNRNVTFYQHLIYFYKKSERLFQTFKRNT